jgi:hypothetical protein
MACPDLLTNAAAEVVLNHVEGCAVAAKTPRNKNSRNNVKNLYLFMTGILF